MSSTDPATVKTLQHLDQARQVLAGAHTLLRADTRGRPGIDDLVEARTLVAAVAEELPGVNVRMIAAARPATSRLLPARLTTAVIGSATRQSQRRQRLAAALPGRRGL